MKIAIIGAGVMGSIIGSFLVKGGADVWFVDPFEAHMKAVNEKGLTIEKTTGEVECIRVKAVTEASQVGETMDALIVLVKGLFTESAMEGAKCLVDQSTLVMTLQNGVGHTDILEKFFPRENIMYGCMMVSGKLIEPGAVFAKCDERSYVRVGSLTKKITPKMEELAGYFTAGGLNFSLTQEIDKEIWTKMITNCTGNSLCGVTRLPVGRLLNDENSDAGLILAKKIEEEIVAVANAIGVELETGHIRCVPTSNVHMPSMAQDMQRQKTTEIGFLNGAVVALGRKYGIPTPYNEAAELLIRVIEKNYDHQQW